MSYIHAERNFRKFASGFSLPEKRCIVLMCNHGRYLFEFQFKRDRTQYYAHTHLSYITVSSLFESSLPLSTISPYIFPSALPLSLISSTLPLPSVIPGTTHSPQLHFIPCHAYRPTLCPHFLFGQNNRPSSFPSSSSGRIHDRGVMWMCAQADWGLGGDVWEDGGVCGTRYEDVARGARHRLQRKDIGGTGGGAVSVSTTPSPSSERLVPPGRSSAPSPISPSSDGCEVSSLNLKSPTLGA